MELLKQIETVVLQAGDIVLSARDVLSVTKEKTSPADVVTAYDVKVENFLKEKLLALVDGAIFFGEEEKENQDPTRGWAFIVDPIDGTANFVRGLRQSAVSVALAKDGRIEYAVVLDPYRKELFAARRGAGAFMNGQPIHVSELPLSKGIFAMGTTPYRKEYREPTARMMDQLLDRSCDLRRMGAAVLDLCAVACGRLELFFEYHLSPWDFAAGSLLVSEAGGCVSTMQGGPLDLVHGCSVWACNHVNRDVLAQLEV